jgi:hypothetical protein
MKNASSPTIKVSVRSVDGYHKARSFRTIAGARKFATNAVGEHPEMGSSYAVSADGVSTVRVQGASLNELFAVAKGPDDRSGDFAIFNTWCMEDHSGTRIVSRHTDEEDAVLALDFHMRNDHAEAYHYGATFTEGAWVKWPAMTYNGKTAAEIMAETYPEGPF